MDLGEMDKQMKAIVKSSGNLLDEFLQECGKSKTVLDDHYGQVLEKVDTRVQLLTDQLNSHRDKLIGEIKEQQASFHSMLEEGVVSNFILESWTSLKEIKDTSYDPALNDDDRQTLISKCKLFLKGIEHMKELSLIHI